MKRESNVNRPAPLEIRSLQHRDMPQFEAHLGSLDTDSLHARFNGVVTAKAISDYLARINLNRDLLVGAFDAAGCLLGAAHVTIFHDAGYPAGELGVSVQVDQRNRGIGFKLICFARHLLLEQGVTDFHIVTHHLNAPMRHIARKLEGSYRVGDDEIQLHVPIQPRESRHKIRSDLAGGIERFSGEVVAPDAPIVVLLHGAGGEAWQWRKLVMPHLHDRGVESIAISLPSHGKSESAGVKAALPAIIEIVQSATKGRAALLVGHSMGGYVAQRCAAELRDLVRALVLVCSVPPFNPLGLECSRVLDQVRERLPTEQAKALLYQTIDAVGPIDTSAVRCPVTCIAGVHDKVVPLEWSRITARIYRADLIVLDGGHDLMQSFSWRVLTEVIADRAHALVAAAEVAAIYAPEVEPSASNEPKLTDTAAAA